MKPVLDERKGPAQGKICPSIQACPEAAILYIEDSNALLRSRIVFDYEKCIVCGDCVAACCGMAIELKKSIRRRIIDMLTIKVLGPGCANCQNLSSLTQRAINNLSIDAKVEKVTEHAEIVKYKILATPGLVINEKVVSAGRVPSEAEITTFLTNALMGE